MFNSQDTEHLNNIITLSEDYGDVINIDNFIFEKQQLVVEDFSYSIKTEDIIHISGIVFDVDDNNISHGNAHREWTATEVALASLPENKNFHKLRLIIFRNPCWRMLSSFG